MERGEAMAKRKSKSNPEAGGMLLLAGVAAAAYYAYSQGWFGGGTAVATLPSTPQPTTGTINPVINPATQIVNTPSTPPPLGTVVNNANDIAAQLAAKYPYIIPDPSNVNALGGPIAQAGYTNVTYIIDRDAVTGTPITATIYLRPDVATAVNAGVQNRMDRSGGTADPNDTLLQIQQAMSASSLSGLRGRSTGWGGYRM